MRPWGPPTPTVHDFLAALIGRSSYQTISAPAQLLAHPRRGTLQGPLRPVVDLPISPHDTENPTHAAADRLPSKAATCFCARSATSTCPTGCPLHAPSHLNTEEKRGKRDEKGIEIRRENWLGWESSRPYRTIHAVPRRRQIREAEHDERSARREAEIAAAPSIQSSCRRARPRLAIPDYEPAASWWKWEVGRCGGA
jgi:hypothetical protein